MSGEISKQYEESLERVVRALADRSFAKVAKNVGLHENTIRAIATGKHKRPSIETLEILAAYLFAD